MPAAGEIFEFGDFTLDPAERLLLMRGQPRHLTAKTFDLLIALNPPPWAPGIQRPTT
jgi:DNA-binding response OmpR family regulator